MKINRVAIVYLIIVSIAFIIIREAIHSKYFASMISQKATSLLSEKISGNINIGKIKLEVFPFGMDLQDVQVSAPDLDIKLASISVVFGFQNIFKSNVFLERVQLNEGLIRFKSNENIVQNEKNSSKEQIENFQKLWADLYKKINSLPVKIENLIVQNINLEIDQVNLTVPRAHLQLVEEIKARLLIEKITNLKLHEGNLLFPDQITLNLLAQEDSVFINDLTMQKGMARISAAGRVNLIDNISLDEFKILVNGPDQAFFNLLPPQFEFDKTFRAYSNSEIILNGEILKPTIEARLNFQNIDGQYLKAKSITSNIYYDGEGIEIRNILISDDSGTVEIKSHKSLLISKLNEGHKVELDLNFNKLKTNTIFHFLNGKLDPFDATFTGELKANITKNNLQIESFEGVNLGLFNLKLNPAEPLFSLNSPQAQKIKIDVNFQPFKLNLDSVIELHESEIVVTANIDNKGIQASLNAQKFSFIDIPQISKVPLSGNGKLDIGISGPWENVQFNLRGNFDSASVAEYNLGSLSFEGELPLKEKKLMFKKIEAKKGSTSFNAKVYLALEPKAYPLMIEYDAERATYNDLIEILAPIIPKELKDYKNIQARFKTKGKVNVDFNNRPVKIDLNLKGNSLSYEGEYFDGFGAEVLMNAGRLNVRNVYLQKEDSKGAGVVIWDTETNYLEYEFLMNNLSLRSVSAYKLTPFSLDGNLSFDIYGSGILNTDHTLRATAILGDSKIKRVNVANSRLDAYYSKGEWTIQAELMEGLARAEAFIPQSGKSNKNTLIRLDVSAADIRPLVGLLAPDKINDPSLSGRMFSQVQASFPNNKPEYADMKLDIRDIELNYKMKKFRLSKSNTQSVEKGVFKNWIFSSTPESDLRLMSNASGDLGGNFNLNSNYNIPAEFFELASDKFYDLTGNLSGSTNIEWAQNGFKAFVNNRGTDVELRLKDVPGKFSDFVFEAKYENDNLKISKLNGRYGRGEFSVNGDIKAKFPYPNVNLKLSTANVTIPFFNKSEVNFDNRFTLIGSRPPYLFSGTVLIQRLLLLEDVGTYLGKVSSSSNYEKFIPNSTQNFINQFIELDASVISNNTIKVSNPLMNLNLSMNLKLSGQLTSPQMMGTVSGIPGQSKIAFKGHEFILSRSVVEFDANSGASKANIDLNGKTLVSGYNIDLNVNGAIDQMSILLNSEPPLPQDEIVSLLTLGITSDISKNLNDQDRRSITTMSLGGFLFDQLQLTRGLDDDLGLKFSLAPEFSGVDGNLIEEASSDTSTTRRLKTGTKLRVQSQLGKKTSVSFSSTLGGEVEQKQEMNVNYDFNRAWSLEGVYELKSSTEENQIETQSIGADVKYKWSF